MKNIKEYVLVVCIIILGIIIGILSKVGDVSGQGSVLGDTLYAFGYVSSGFFIWVVICTIIAVIAKNQIWAGVNVFLFLTSMILSYYFYSYLIVEYLEWSIVKFWVVMLIPAAILGAIVWKIKTNQPMKFLVVILGTAIFARDISEVIFYYPIATMMQVSLYVIFLAFILLNLFNKSQTLK
jgi:hypothetical protein